VVFIHIANQNVQIATDIVRYDISPKSLDMEKKERKKERKREREKWLKNVLYDCN
jgi:hypothetical protein